jgi:hypothetical protein
MAEWKKKREYNENTRKWETRDVLVGDVEEDKPKRGFAEIAKAAERERELRAAGRYKGVKKSGLAAAAEREKKRREELEKKKRKH